MLWIQFDLGPTDLIYKILGREMNSHLLLVVNQSFNPREQTPLVDFCVAQ